MRKEVSLGGHYDRFRKIRSLDGTYENRDGPYERGKRESLDNE